MSGAYPDTTNFRSIEVKDIKNRLTNIDDTNKLYEKFMGQQWQLTLDSTSLSRTQFAGVFVFLTQQKGEVETFTIVPPVIASTQGTASGTVTVTQAYAIGVSSVRANGASGTLKKGDFIKFSNHNKVYQLTADVNMDASSEDTIAFYPKLKSAVTSSTTITYNSVPFSVAMTSDNVDYKLDMQSRYQYSLTVRETG
jgi:hypothetical protein|tara:strand:- start:3723 stop:4310 length:588 start_codon:yes stop_codon:yes gene_type:complete